MNKIADKIIKLTADKVVILFYGLSLFLFLIGMLFFGPNLFAFLLCLLILLAFQIMYGWGLKPIFPGHKTYSFKWFIVHSLLNGGLLLSLFFIDVHLHFSIKIVLIVSESIRCLMVAKYLRSFEEGRKVSLGAYIGTAFLFLNFLIGIWVLWPRMQKIYLKQNN